MVPQIQNLQEIHKNWKERNPNIKLKIVIRSQKKRTKEEKKEQKNYKTTRKQLTKW